MQPHGSGPEGRPPWPTGGPPWHGWAGPPLWWPAAPLAGISAAIQLGGSWGRAHAQGVVLEPLDVVLLLAGPAAILLLRRLPLVPLAVASAASVAWIASGHPVFPVLAAPVAALLLEGFRRRRERWAAAREAYRTRTQQRRSDERVAMARDLHDVLGHSLTLINVQAGAALHTFDRDPENARRALATVKSESHRALEEVRRVLDAVRDPASAPATAPGPGLADVRRLVEADAGFAWDLDTTGTPRTLPPAVDAAAYRVVQEAMTNVRRHSGARRASIRVSFSDTGLDLVVEDPGDEGAPRETAAAPGTGLVGMRERVEGVGGTLTVGPVPPRGHRVAAAFPLRREEGA